MAARRNKRQDFESGEHNLAGWLLVAHPSLLDANFKQTIVLISAHSKETGAIGVIVNRPLEQTLGSFKAEYNGHPLGNVPLYFGGPVAPEEMILTAWQSTDDPVVFKLYFGLSLQKAEELLTEDPAILMRGFIGYSGWSSGQLEGELSDNAWAVCPLDGATLHKEDAPGAWKRLLKRIRPEWSFLADGPADPGLN
ncbi:MAG: YqgE/AlgH family protein [Verrucomicrobiota bacterium]|nr:YqgE/AlgH family protein [Verrucomicrobiota bacterium]